MSRSSRRLNGLFVLLSLVLLIGCAGSSNRQSRSQKSEAAETNVQLASSYYGQARYELAKEKIDRALQLNSGSALAHSVAGVIYEKIGEHEKAGDHYKRSVNIDGDNPNALNNYGQYLCKIGQYDDGIRHLENAISKPFYSTPQAALTNAGDCAERKKDWNQAERYYRRALDMDGNNPDALFRLARLMLAKGEAFSARAFLQRLESLVSPYPETLRLGRDIEKALGNAEGVADYEQQLRELYPSADKAGAADSPTNTPQQSVP